MRYRICACKRNEQHIASECWKVMDFDDFESAGNYATMLRMSSGNSHLSIYIVELK